MLLNIIVFFLLSLIQALEQPTIPYVCNFAGVPLDVCNRIAFYLSYENNFFETDDCFIKRISKSKGMLYEKKLSKTQSLKIKNGNLQWIICNDIALPPQQKIIISAEGKASIQKYDESFNKSWSVHCFTLSPDANFIVALIKNYFKTPPATEVEIFKLHNAEYIKERHIQLEFPGDITFAISNDGQLAFRTKSVVGWTIPQKMDRFVEIYQKLKCTVPDNVPEFNSLCWANRIVDIQFNKQGTKLGIKFHFLYECLRIGKNQIITYDEAWFRNLLKLWFEKKYTNYEASKYQKIIELLNLPIKYPQDFFKRFQELINIFILRNLISGIDESCPIKIISLNKQINQPEESWTLENFFKFRGVCKNFNKQCGFKQ